MKPETVIEIVRQIKGQFQRIVYDRPLKLLKKADVPAGTVIVKHTVALSKTGVNRDNRAVVKEARQDGTAPAENQGLNGMEYVEFPILVRGIKSGRLCLVITPTSVKPKVTFYRDGVEVERASLDGIVGASDWKSRPSTGLEQFNIDCNYIVELAGYVDPIESGQTVEMIEESSPVEDTNEEFRNRQNNL